MATLLDDLRERHPEYKNVPDQQLADGLYRKFYSESMTREEFAAKVGLAPADDPAGSAPSMQTMTMGQRAQAIYDRENTPEARQAAADLVGQGIGTTLGIAAGAPGGPVGMTIGGAGGNVAGKIVSRALMGGEEPGLGEGAVDAALGAAGPAASPLLSAVGRGAARVFMGGGRAGVDRVSKASDRLRGAATEAEKAAVAAETAKAEAQSAGGVARAIPTTETQEASMEAAVGALMAKGAAAKAEAAVPKAKADLQKAYDNAVRRATNTLQPFTSTNIGLASVASGLLHDPTSAVMVFFGGHAARGLHAKAAETLLKSDAFVKWALEKPSQTVTSATLKSLGALAGEKELTADERDAVLTLRDSLSEGDTPQRESRAPSPLRERLRRDRRSDADNPRDTLGRFQKRSVDAHPYPWPKEIG